MAHRNRIRCSSAKDVSQRLHTGKIKLMTGGVLPDTYLGGYWTVSGQFVDEPVLAVGMKVALGKPPWVLKP